MTVVHAPNSASPYPARQPPLLPECRESAPASEEVVEAHAEYRLGSQQALRGRGEGRPGTAFPRGSRDRTRRVPISNPSRDARS